MSQQIRKEVDGSFKSFFGLLKLAKQGRYVFKDCKLPHYLPKDGYVTLPLPLDDGEFTVFDNRKLYNISINE